MIEFKVMILCCLCDMSRVFVDCFLRNNLIKCTFRFFCTTFIMSSCKVSIVCMVVMFFIVLFVESRNIIYFEMKDFWSVLEMKYGRLRYGLGDGFNFVKCFLKL